MACLYQMSELGLPFGEMEIDGRHFYTLRVCKDCRASWLGAIKAWFFSEELRQATGTGVFVRENGTNKELTPEEIKKRWPNG